MKNSMDSECLSNKGPGNFQTLIRSANHYTEMFGLDLWWCKNDR